MHRWCCCSFPIEDVPVGKLELVSWYFQTCRMLWFTRFPATRFTLSAFCMGRRNTRRQGSWRVHQERNAVGFVEHLPGACWSGCNLACLDQFEFLDEIGQDGGRGRRKVVRAQDGLQTRSQRC